LKGKNLVERAIIAKKYDLKLSKNGNLDKRIKDNKEIMLLLGEAD
jgi:hypothetical protein